MKVDIERVNKYLEKIKPSTCPLCGKNEWTISPIVYQAPEFDYGGLLISGAMYPVIAISCDNCGNTYFINAIQAGIIDSKSPKEDDTSRNKED